MRVRLDNGKCEGHGRCYSLAPAVFESDDEGYSKLRIEGDIPAELEHEARLAVANCPEYAIEIDE
jgi:ferredoxin